MTPIDYEFYETPWAFTRFLFRELFIRGRVFEPCFGSGAIVRASEHHYPRIADADGHPLIDNKRTWVTNDLDLRWPADSHGDATLDNCWKAAGDIDWTVSNFPFTPAIDILRQALHYSRVGVAVHLRASIHEVLKTGVRRTFMATHTPTGILWLPRFAYQRSKTTGKWTTDSVCACWVIWLKDPIASQFIRYAPEWVIDDLDRETPDYRKRMDAVMADLAARRTA